MLFRSSCPSPNHGYPFWLLALTFRSSRPAFSGRLTSPVRPQATIAAHQGEYICLAQQELALSSTRRTLPYSRVSTASCSWQRCFIPMLCTLSCNHQTSRWSFTRSRSTSPARSRSQFLQHRERKRQSNCSSPFRALSGRVAWSPSQVASSSLRSGMGKASRPATQLILKATSFRSECSAMRSNHSIERMSQGLRPCATAHVKR